MNKCFLLISPFFHPEPISTGKYNTFLAGALSKTGQHIDVICFHPLYPSWCPRQSDDSMPGVNIERGGLWLRYPKSNILRRLVLEVGFLIHLLRYAGRMKRYSQIVVVSPPMLVLPIVRLLSAPNAVITTILHDLQGVMAGIGFAESCQRVVGLIRLLEGVMLRCCHRIIVLSNSMASVLTRGYRLPNRKIKVCWPFVTVDTTNTGRRLKQLFPDGKKHIVYSGALGQKQNPDRLISFFLGLVHHREDVVCHLFSGGPIFEAFRRDQKLQADGLLFHDLVPERDLHELYLRSDIQVIPERIGYAQGAMPSKMPNIMACGVPILYIGGAESDVRQFIQTTGGGLCADTWDIEYLMRSVDRLLLESEDRSHEDRRLAFNTTYGELFSVDVLVRELLK